MMSEEKNNSLRKYIWRNCVTPKSTGKNGSPQTPLDSHVNNPFNPVHDSLHKPLCSPESYYSAVFSYDNSNSESLRGIAEDPDVGSPQRQAYPSTTFWSPEQQAMLCPVRIEDHEVARQAKAEARAYLVCSCGSASKVRTCHIHTVEMAHQAKLNLYWTGPTGPPGLQSPASASPPTSHLHHFQAIAADSRINIDTDDYVTCSSSLFKRISDEMNGKHATVGVQTEFSLPPTDVTPAEVQAVFQAAFLNKNRQDTTDLETTSKKSPIGCVGIGRINCSPMTMGENCGSSKWKRSRHSRDDGALTPRRPCSFNNTPVMSLRRRSFSELDLSPIHGDTECLPEKRTANSQEEASCNENNMSIDENNARVSPLAFAEAEVMSSTCLHSRTVELGEKTNGMASDIDTGYQSLATSSNANITR